jgi:hypothetical protein
LAERLFHVWPTGSGEIQRGLGFSLRFGVVSGEVQKLRQP